MDSAEAFPPTPVETDTFDCHNAGGYVVVDEPAHSGSTTLIQPSVDIVPADDTDSGLLDITRSASANVGSSDDHSSCETALMQGSLSDQAGSLCVSGGKKEENRPSPGELSESGTLEPKKGGQVALQNQPILHAESQEAAVCTRSESITLPEQIPEDYAGSVTSLTAATVPAEFSDSPEVTSYNHPDPACDLVLPLDTLTTPAIGELTEISTAKLAEPAEVVVYNLAEPAFPAAQCPEIFAGAAVIEHAAEVAAPSLVTPDDAHCRLSSEPAASATAPSPLAPCAPTYFELKAEVPAAEGLQPPEVATYNLKEPISASVPLAEAPAVTAQTEPGLVATAELPQAATSNLCELVSEPVEPVESPVLSDIIELAEPAAPELPTPPDTDNGHSKPPVSVLVQPTQALSTPTSAKLAQSAAVELPGPLDIAVHEFSEPTGEQAEQSAESVGLAISKPANTIEADVTKPSEVAISHSIGAAALEEVPQMSFQPKHEAILPESPKVDTCNIPKPIGVLMQQPEARLDPDSSELMDTVKVARTELPVPPEAAINNITEPLSLTKVHTVVVPEVLAASDSSKIVRQTASSEQPEQEVAVCNLPSSLGQPPETVAVNLTELLVMTTSSLPQSTDVLESPPKVSEGTEVATVEQSSTTIPLLQLARQAVGPDVPQADVPQLALTSTDNLAPRALEDMQPPKQDQDRFKQNIENVVFAIGGTSPQDLIKPTGSGDSNDLQNARAPESTVPLEFSASLAKLSPSLVDSTALTTSGRSNLSNVSPESRADDTQPEKQTERDDPVSPRTHGEDPFHVVPKAEIRLGAQPFSSGFARSSTSFRKVTFIPSQGLVSPPITPTDQECYAFPNRTQPSSVPGASSFGSQPLSKIAVTSKLEVAASPQGEMTSHAHSIPRNTASSQVSFSGTTNSAAVISSSPPAGFSGASVTPEPPMLSEEVAELHGVDDERQAIRKALQVRKKVINTWQHAPESSQSNLVDGKTFVRRPSVTQLVQQTGGVASNGPDVIAASKNTIPAKVPLVPPKSTPETRVASNDGVEATTSGRFQRPVIGVTQAITRKEH